MTNTRRREYSPLTLPLSKSHESLSENQFTKNFNSSSNKGNQVQTRCTVKNSHKISSVLSSSSTEFNSIIESRQFRRLRQPYIDDFSEDSNLQKNKKKTSRFHNLQNNNLSPRITSLQRRVRHPVNYQFSSTEYSSSSDFSPVESNSKSSDDETDLSQTSPSPSNNSTISESSVTSDSDNFSCTSENSCFPFQNNRFSKMSKSSFQQATRSNSNYFFRFQSNRKIKNIRKNSDLTVDYRASSFKPLQRQPSSVISQDSNKYFSSTFSIKHKDPNPFILPYENNQISENDNSNPFLLKQDLNNSFKKRILQNKADYFLRIDPKPTNKRLQMYIQKSETSSKKSFNSFDKKSNSKNCHSIYNLSQNKNENSFETLNEFDINMNKLKSFDSLPIAMLRNLLLSIDEKNLENDITTQLYFFQIKNIIPIAFKSSLLYFLKKLLELHCGINNLFIQQNFSSFQEMKTQFLTILYSSKIKNDNTPIPQSLKLNSDSKKSLFKTYNFCPLIINDTFRIISQFLSQNDLVQLTSVCKIVYNFLQNPNFWNFLHFHGLNKDRSHPNSSRTRYKSSYFIQREIFNIIRQPRFSKITFLDISDLTLDDEIIINHVALYCPKIQVIDASNCRPPLIWDAIMKENKRKLSNLFPCLKYFITSKSDILDYK